MTFILTVFAMTFILTVFAMTFILTVFVLCFQLNLSMLLRFSLQIVGSLVFMFYLNPALTGVLLAVVPVVSLGAVQYGTFTLTL